MFSNNNLAFFFLLLFIMSQKTRGRPGSVFGAPEPFSGARLPTYLEVGKQYLQSKIDLSQRFPGRKIKNVAVSAEVENEIV
jgi:hypothetical protein